MKRIRRPVRFVLLSMGLGVGLAFSQGSPPTAALKEKYQHFLEVTYWIMTPKEREVFQKLSTDEQRDRFIELFWKMRDPTPGTPENEYRDEMERRFAYVNQRFRFGGVPGWKTDRGRVYMVLGPPKSTERFDMDLDVYPTEVWYYYGEGRPGLPAHFAMVFYKPHGVGDYKLYSPSGDGPYSLFIRPEGLDPFNYEALYDKLQAIHPTLAQVVLSPIPGDIPMGFTPSPEADLLIARILESPRASFDDSYARDFERYAGMIDIEEANRFISARFAYTLQWWPDLGYHVWAYAFQPETISVAETDTGIYSIFETVGSIDDESTGRRVYQFQKRFRLDFKDEAELRRVRASGVLLADAVPLIPGSYRVRVLLKNPLGREFSFWEDRLSVPAVPPGQTYADPPILGYRTEPADPALLSPFQTGLYRFAVDLKQQFTAAETLYVGGRVYTPEPADVRLQVEVQSAEPGQKPVPRSSRPASLTPTARVDTYEWLVPVGLKDLPPGRYQVVVSLQKGSTTVGTWTLPFSVTPLGAVPHPQAYTRSLRRTNLFAWDLAAGEQAWAQNRTSEAEAWLRRAHQRKPDFEPAALRLAEFYLATKRPGEALNLLQVLPSENAQRRLFQVLARQALNGCETTLPEMERLLQAGQRHWRLLRALGLCYWTAGQRDRARPLLQDALAANPDQPDLKALLGPAAEKKGTP
ncbi:Beta-barrel assembly-enhancing protease [bacterium HR11]|nr:Beta-barrel assembly-enhancing protease [bacterium HR11]